MNETSRLFIALHALLHLHRNDGTPLTSEAVAGCLGTNPVVIRRTLGALREHGLVRSTRGPGGGWTLAARATDISLGSVSRAVDQSLIDLMSIERSGAGCLVVRSLSVALHDLLIELRELVEARLQSLTLADLALQVSTEAGRAASLLPQEATDAH